MGKALHGRVRLPDQPLGTVARRTPLCRDNIHPFFYGHELEDGTPLPYGRELYPAESFFRTDQKVYSRTALSYRRSFFDDTVSVRAEFAAHHDGTALGTQQMLVVGVKLLKTVYNSKNHKK